MGKKITKKLQFLIYLTIVSANESKLCDLLS